MALGLAAASIVFSLVLACGAPFAGLAAVAALTLGLRGAVGATLLAFAANQAVGFGVLGYPVTADSIGWGVALGLSAGLAAVVASAAAGLDGLVTRATVAFLGAFLVQQATVFAATAVLPSHPDAFAQSVILSILATNALAFALFGGLTALAFALASRRWQLARVTPALERIAP
ncbi:MAG: hypothetical protein AAGF49_06865 [Pseudomonadota bacterium]